MRSLLSILLLVNLVVFAAQFEVIRALVGIDAPAIRPGQVNAERLRIIHDTSERRLSTPAPDSPAGQPTSGTNS